MAMENKIIPRIQYEGNRALLQNNLHLNKLYRKHLIFFPGTKNSNSKFYYRRFGGKYGTGNHHRAGMGRFSTLISF